VAGRPPGRDLGGPADEHGRAGLLHRRGRHPDGDAAVLERLAGERGHVHGELLVEQAGAVADRQPHHLELAGHVAQPHHDVDAAVGELVDDERVLGRPHRVEQRQDQGGHDDAALLGHGGDGVGHHERRREVAVVGAVVLGDQHVVDPEPVRPGDLLEGGPVQLRRRRADVGCPQVVADRPASSHRGAPPSGATAGAAACACNQADGGQGRYSRPGPGRCPPAAYSMRYTVSASAT
jgi:hypothetical protein